MASTSSKAAAIAKASSKVFDYQPKSRWCGDKESKVLEIEVPEFKRDELRVQTDASGGLKVSGLHRIDSRKSSQFEESFSIPGDVEHSPIKAKLDAGVLRIIMPIKKMPATGEGQTKRGRPGRDHLGFCLGTQRRRIVSACVCLATLAAVMGLYAAYRQGFNFHG